MNNMVSCNIYSKDKDVAPPLLTFWCKPKEIAAAVEAGQFPMEEVTGFFKRAVEAVQEAIQAGREHATSTKKS